MYTDPSLIREHVVKLSFNDREHELVTAWVNYSGEQKAAFLRKIVLDQARRDLEATMSMNEGPQHALFGN